jgi:hypothetical protein
MHAAISNRLARLASLAAQRRYIVHGTCSEYYFPSELLNDADYVVRQVRTVPAVRGCLSAATVQAVLDFERLLDAAGTAVQSAASNEELVERDQAWCAIREHAARCLATMSFDLREWERVEGLDHAA